MALDLDTSAALRGINDLRRLVAAIVAGDEHAEADWVEWKSTLDLSSKGGCFHVARAVLGMANRTSDRAGLTADGLGYVVVGAEPGTLAGVDSVDPARLDQLIEPYLGGADGPRCTPTYVPVDDKTVLVVTVEAPKSGDRIFTLRREFPKYDANDKEVGKYANGTVFVRKHGRTTRADAGDLDALQARLVATPAPSAELEVSLVGDVPLSWFDGSTTADVIETWVAKQRDHLVVAAKTEERRRHPPGDAGEQKFSGFAGLQASALFAQHAQLEQMRRAAGGFNSLLGEDDTRTLDEYVAQVDDWAKRLSAAAANAIPGRYVAAGNGVVALHVRNPSERFLPDVEVEAHFEWERAVGFEDRPRREYLPPPPRAYGERKPPPGLLGRVTPYIPFSSRASLGYPQPIVGPGRRTRVEDGSIRIRFHIGDLRQHASDTSDEVCVLISERPEGGALKGTWKATIRDVNGVLSGALDVRVAEEPVNLQALLEAEPADEG